MWYARARYSENRLASSPVNPCSISCSSARQHACHSAQAARPFGVRLTSSARRLGAAPIGRILEDFAQEAGPTSFADGQKLSIAGVVTSSKVKTTRSNTLMAYVTVEDSTGAMEMLCFARTLETSGSYLKEGQTILASGRLSVRDEKAPQLMCDSARPLDGSAADVSAGAAGEKRQTLYLRLPSMDSHEMTQFRRIAYLFEGKEPVRIRLIDSGKLIGTTAALHPAFVRAMRELLGDENVVLK